MQGTDQKLDAVKKILAGNEPVTMREACERAGVSYRTAYRHGIRSPKRVAGGRPPLTDSVLADALQKAAESLGRTPTSSDFQCGQEIGHMTYYRRYGSWDAALEAAGLEPIRWREKGLPAKMRLCAHDLSALGVIDE